MVAFQGDIFGIRSALGADSILCYGFSRACFNVKQMVWYYYQSRAHVQVELIVHWYNLNGFYVVAKALTLECNCTYYNCSSSFIRLSD